MDQPPRSRHLLRWSLVVAIVVLGASAAIYFRLLVLLTGFFPIWAADALIVLVGVLASSLAAPKQRLPVAGAIAAIFGLLAPAAVDIDLVGTTLGAALGVALVAWSCHSSPPRRATTRIAWALGLTTVVGVSAAYARYLHLPARAAALPPVLTHVLGDDAHRVTAFYCYNRGGFINQSWLWRIDGPPEVIARTVAELELEATPTVPEQFWHMPPHYWPRTRPTTAEAFRSPQFSADQLADGSHYFLLHDRGNARAFVWVKDNF